MCAMYVLWIICGAGRRVGKTHLARKLCEVLPKSIHAKLGHGRRKPDGRANFFTALGSLQDFLDQQRQRRRHVVVESNDLAARKDADVVIYLAPQIGRKMDVRSDAEALRSVAGVRIEPGASPKKWNRALADILPDTKLRRMVLDVLNRQAAFAASPNGDDGDSPASRIPPIAARTKLWLETDGKHALGRGLALLLEGVDAGGSLTKAAAKAGMSYRYAWQLVHQAETNLGAPLLIARSGGRHGGGSSLSATGRKLRGVFEKLNVEVAAFASERLKKLIRETTEDE